MLSSLRSLSGRFWAAAFSLCMAAFLLWRLLEPSPLSSRDFAELHASIEVVAPLSAHASVAGRGPRCDFTEISLEQVGDVEYFQHTHMKNATRPVIIRDAMPSLAAWAQRFHMQSLADMVSAYGNASVHAVSTGRNAVAPFKTLAEFAQYAEMAAAVGTRNPVPVFDQNRPQEKLWSARAFAGSETLEQKQHMRNGGGSYQPIVGDLPIPDCFQDLRNVGQDDRNNPATQLHHVRVLACTI